MCELLVGLPEVTVLAVADVAGEPLRVHVETREPRPSCPGCGGDVAIKDRPAVELMDLAVFGRRARLIWRKHRWSCPASSCPTGSWTGEHPAIAAPRLGMTDRAGRWVTEQVGRHGRTVNEIALELGCDWHTINDTVLPTAPRSSRTQPGSAYRSRSAWTRPSSPGSGSGVASRGRPRSSMSKPAGSSMLSLVAARRSRAAGSPNAATRGWRTSGRRRSICRARTAACSTRCSPTPPRSPIRSTS